MEYNRFLTIVRKNKLYVFSANEMTKYFSDSADRTIQNQLQLWTEKRLLIRLRRGLYCVQFPEGGPDLPDLYLANRIYEPSYVSLETALSFYSLIPEVAIQVTAVTTRQTKLFKNKFGSFKYSSCKNEAYLGYKIMLYEGFKIYIAEKEKAIVDFIYFKQRIGERVNPDRERFDREGLEKISWNKVFRYARIYNKKTLATTKRIKEWLK